MSDHDALNEITGRVLAAAIALHRWAGPGLLENVYRQCLVHDLRVDGLHVESDVGISLRYKDCSLPVTYRLDVVVERRVVLELKAVLKVLPVHEAQLRSYLRLGNYPVGLLLNFCVPVLKDGITRVINT